jgi:uncharacterized membrane-anchored protein
VRDARIALPPGFLYLNAADARRTLTDLYGNPPAPEVRGMILPPKSSVIRNTYVIVVTYENGGHISDADAASIDYNKMLRSLQKDEPTENAERVKEGYDPIHLVAWAEQPHYDGRTHKLYWADDLVFGQERVHTLNYRVRTLGREGMLALNAIADKQDIAAVRSGMQKVLATSRFVDGRRYEDFHQGDRVSNLTVAAVVAGGAYAVAKTGLLALLIAKLKFVAFGAVALVAAVRRRLFGRRRRPIAD